MSEECVIFTVLHDAALMVTLVLSDTYWLIWLAGFLRTSHQNNVLPLGFTLLQCLPSFICNLVICHFVNKKIRVYWKTAQSLQFAIFSCKNESQRKQLFVKLSSMKHNTKTQWYTIYKCKYLIITS